MHMLSRRFIDKLNSKLTTDPIVEQLEDLLETKNGFSSKQELHNHLSEGALLNVGVLASKALSVPCGEYMVWCTEAGHTMLVPVNEANRTSQDVFENKTDPYDIFTNVLLNNWSKLSRTIAEDEQPEQFKHEGVTDEDEPEIKGEVDESSVDRISLLRAMQERGFTVTSLAEKCGVQAPAISRLLREPKSGKGDPGGRNPSMGLAGKVCSILRLDPTAAFPDIFQGKYKAKDVKANRGSGMSGAAAGSTKKGEASKLFTKGNSNE